jgi:hypothetical protein
MKTLCTLVVCLCIAVPAFAAPPPKISKAADGIFAAFQTHSLVGIGEWHGLAQELDFYASLVRDPRFATEVGNIVLETGDAAQQPVVDRYVNGESVPYNELRRVWSDTVGWFPAVSYVGSVNLYAVIRAVNQGLAPENRIKVWLGEPPIDWSHINSKADWQPLEDQRDTYPAALIEREILGRDKKALVIYGTAHWGLYPGGVYPEGFLPTAHPTRNLRTLIEVQHPSALYIMVPYIGFSTKACARKIEKQLRAISAPSLISPVRGSSLERDLIRPGCTPFAKYPGETQETFEVAIRNNVGLTSNALLYLGPRSSLKFSPGLTDNYLDLDYRAELDRRMRLRTGEGMKAPDPANNPATARPYRLD